MATVQPLKTAADLVAEAKKQVQTCSAQDAADRIAAGDVQLVLDVREPAEFAQGHLEGAVNVPRGLLEWQIAKVCTDPATPILVHCASGGRAVLAARTLKEMGYGPVVAAECPFTELASCVDCA